METKSQLVQMSNDPTTEEIAVVVKDIKVKITDIHINNDEDFEKAKEFAGAVKNVTKSVNDKRLSVVREFNAKRDKEQQPFQLFLNQLKELQATLDKPIIAYQRLLQQRERERLEAERQKLLAEKEAQLQEAAVAVEEKGTKGSINAMSRIATQKAKLENKEIAITKTSKGAVSSTVKVKWFAVLLNEEKVPREFCKPDTTKLNKYGNSFKGEKPPAVEGVEWKSNESIGYK